MIEIYLPFGENEVDRKNFTASLLALCSAHGIIDDEKAAQIRDSMLTVFIETLEQFTLRESSSVSNAHAASIYESVLYRADVYLMSLHSIPKAVEKIKNADFSEILSEGSRMIIAYFNEAAKFADKAQRNMLKNCSAEYEFACVSAYKQFRKRYSARFFAKNINIEIDYPLLYSAAFEMEESGVVFMHKYLKCLMLENEFMSLFRKSEVRQLLIKYGEMLGSRYTDLLVNYCSVVFNNFLLCAVLGKENLSIRLDSNDIDSIYNSLRFCTEEQIKNTVRKAFGQYYKIIGKHNIIMYLRNYTDIFAHELYVHLNNGTLGAFAVVF